MDQGVPAFLVAVPAERMTPGHYRDPKKNLIAEKALDDLNNFMFVGAKPATLVKHRVGTPARATPTSPKSGWKSLVVSPQEPYGRGSGESPLSPAAAPGTLELLSYDPSRGELPPLSENGDDGTGVGGDADGEERSRKIRKTMSETDGSATGSRSHSDIVVPTLPTVELQEDDDMSVKSGLASATLNKALNDGSVDDRATAVADQEKQSVVSSEAPHEDASGTTTSRDTESVTRSASTAPLKPKAAAKPPAPPTGNTNLNHRGYSTGSLARRLSQGSTRSRVTEVPAPSPLVKLEGETARIPDSQDWSRPLYKDLENSLAPYSSLGFSPSTGHGSPYVQAMSEAANAAMDRYRTQRADTNKMRQIGARRASNDAPQDQVLDGFALLRLAQEEIPDDVYVVNMNDRGYHDVVKDDLEEFTELQRVIAGINNFSFEMFAPLKKLQDLHLPCNHLSHITIPPQSFTNIRELQLAFNRLNGMDTIRSLLHGLPQLETLNLSDNNITRFPEDSLRGVTALRTLILDHNHLNSDDCPFTVLSQLPNLQVLSMERNDICTVPRPACHQGFKSLFTLNICHNRIASVADAAATARIKSLMQLFLWGNPMTKFDDLCGEHLAKSFSRRQAIHIHVIDPEAEFRKAPYRPLSASQILERRGKRFQVEDQQIEDTVPSESLDHLIEVQPPPVLPPPPGPQVHGRVDSIGKVSRDEIDKFKRKHTSPKRMPDSFSTGHSIYRRGGADSGGSGDEDDTSPREKKVEEQRSVFLTAIGTAQAQENDAKDEQKAEVKMHGLFKKRANVPGSAAAAKPKKNPTTSSLKVFKKMRKTEAPPRDPDRPPSPLKAAEDFRGTSPPPKHSFNRVVEKRATVPLGESPKTAIPRVMVRQLAGVEEQKKAYEFKNGYSFNREWTRKECTCCNMFDPESENHYTEAEVNSIFKTLDHYVEKGRNLKVIKDPFKEFGEELRILGDESESDDEVIEKKKKEFKQSNFRQMEFGINALQRTKIIHKRGNIAERDRMHEMEVAWVKSRKTGPMPEPIRNIVEKMQDRLAIAALEEQDKKDSALETLFLESQAAFLGREFSHGIKNTVVHPMGPPSVENTEPRNFQRERRSVTSPMPAIANLRGRPKI